VAPVDKAVAGLLLIAVYTVLIYYFFLYLAPIMIALGGLLALIAHLVNYFLAVKSLIRGELPNDQRDLPYPQPLYFFKGAWFDLRDVLVNSWQRDVKLLNELFDWCHVELMGGPKGPHDRVWLTWPLLVVIATIAAASVLIAAIVSFFITLVFCAIAVFLIFLGYCVMFVVRITELGFFKCVSRCKVCKKDCAYPVYVCGKCAELHRELIPSIFGVLSKKCRCGKKLPTSYLFGRESLLATCPDSDCKGNYKLKKNWKGWYVYFEDEQVSGPMEERDAQYFMDVGRGTPLPTEAAKPRHPNVLLSFCWFLLALNLALLSPWFSFLPRSVGEALHFLLPFVTFAFILWNLKISVGLMKTQGEFAPLAVSLPQFFLFVALFFQIYAHWGAHHYQLEGPPSISDWFFFAVAHALRAADLLDVIHSYNLQIQAIHHSSLLVSVCLVAFHLIVDLFILGLLLKYGKKILSKKLDASFGKKEHLEWKVAFGVSLFCFFVLALCLTIVQIRWAPSDLLIWGLDNLIRAIDLPGIMQIYHIYFHHPPAGWWFSTLSVLFRFFLTVLLLTSIIKWTHHWLEKTVDKSTTRFRFLDRFSKFLSRHVSVARLAAGVCAVAGLLLLVLLFVEPPVEELGYRAIMNEEDFARPAIAGLRRLGPAAKKAIPILIDALPSLPPDRQIEIAETMGTFGLIAGPYLQQLLIEGNRNLAMVALKSLARLGPKRIPFLVAGLNSPDEMVQLEIQVELERIHYREVPFLLETIDSKNVNRLLPIAERQDQGWHTRFVSNPSFSTVLQAFQIEVDALSDLDNTTRLQIACKELGEIGPLAVHAQSALENLLKHRNTAVQKAAKHALLQIGSR
jgi:hypothetical protein